MTEASLDFGAAAAATMLQHRAADPARSVFVSANAGTGKTQVLTMRVLRLLLSGAAPDTILCLTYTKAAAAEMRSRLYEKLAFWAICDESELIDSLTETGETEITQTRIDTARSLFAHSLDHEDGPMIETVHSFCQSVLMRFPVEAGIAPHFSLISDHERDQLLTDCFYDLLSSCTADANTATATALRLLSAQTDEMKIFAYLTDVLGNRRHIHDIAYAPEARAAFEQLLCDEYGFMPAHKWPQFEAAILAELATLPLAEIADILCIGKVRQQARGQKIKSWLNGAPDQKARNLSQLASVFLTDKGEVRKQLSDSAIDAARPDCAELQAAVIACLERFQSCFACVNSYELTMALNDCGAALYRRFQTEKSKRAVLDYDDLIFFTEQLLAQHEKMAWVRWKLDRGINHLLIDEAQDTSPEQWALISHLVAPFLDNNDDLPQRTIFGVGDFKQSIYSFQGARPEIFAERRDDFVARLKQAQMPVSVIDFNLSFRSAAAVLALVDKMLSSGGMNGFGNKEALPHHSYRKGMAGLVEVWPVLEAEPGTPAPYFSVPQQEGGGANDGALAQAQRVVRHISSLLDGAEDGHFGRPVEAQDILILLRKRDKFYALLRAELERAGIAVAGADRLSLNNQIEILDLLALADICLLPEDDLQLACLLKSPLIGLSEEALIELATGRGNASLYDQLMTHLGAESAPGKAAGQIRNWQQLSQQLPPFEFFSLVLSSGGRRAFHRRLGHAVDDSLDAFLLRAREHGNQQRPGLLHFVSAFRQGDSIIKRDLDTKAGGAVRVMSIHGAKGLEAPIVYLPDMLRATLPSRAVIAAPRGVFWPAGAPVPQSMQKLKDDAKENLDAESSRLLYVALTRARQALFISGWQQGRRRFEQDSWYQCLHKAIQECAGAVEVNEGVWRLTSGGPESVADTTNTRLSPQQADAAPQWFDALPPAEPSPARPLTPSDLGPRDHPPSFTVADRKKALLRGSYIHKLLEVLPVLPEDRKWPAAMKIAADTAPPGGSIRTAAVFDDSEVKAIFAEVQRVMTEPGLGQLFSARARAEVAVSGLVGPIVVNGQIDRLVVSTDEIIIADFKTGMPPQNADDIAPAYLRQMALYSALLRQIYPARTLRCLLIWTQTLYCHEISAKDQQRLADDIIAAAQQGG